MTTTSYSSSVRSSSAGFQVSSTLHGDEYSVASPSQAPSSVRSRPQSQPDRPSEQATGRGGSTREAPRRAIADRISASSSSSGVGVHTPATVGAAGTPFDGSQLCAETDPEAFFPGKGGSVREAKRICGLCHLQPDCLAYALHARSSGYPLAGIWGGTTERERRALRRRLAAHQHRSAA